MLPWDALQHREVQGKDTLKERMEVFHQEMVRGCEDKCVSIQEGGGGGIGPCHRDGYADLVICGHDEASKMDIYPLLTDLKGQREYWDVVKGNASSMPFFDIDISQAIFPEMFPDAVAIHVRPNICGVYNHVRKMVQKRRVAESAVPGTNTDDPHILIMLSQNGRVYPAQQDIRFIYRVMNLVDFNNNTGVLKECLLILI